ncbi:MAG: hypothetical protein JWO30_598 [Fibrobacteres bacterium]|nr:hypothetical protein [Fibrobacterota bacterium]
MMKRIFATLYLTIVLPPAFAGALRIHETTGSAQQLLQQGATAANVKTIAPSVFQSPGNGSGKVVHGVNLFTGQSSYSVPLGGISARGVSFPITLGYSGDTKATLDNDNEKAPTSWVGLGFNLSTPFIAVNHKGTYSSFDDVIYCNLGPYGGGQILIDSARTRYFVSTNPYIKIAFDTATTGEYASQFTKWTFTFPDGKKMMFGQDTNAQRYVFYNNGLIKASPYSYVGAKRFIYRWDLRTFYDTLPGGAPKNILNFEYERFLDSAAPGKSYVREGYLKNIKWTEGSQEVERYEFKTAAKGSVEYVGYGPNENRVDQKLFETRRLDTLKCYKEGSLTHFYKFDWISQSKGLLDKIKLFYPKSFASTFVQDSGWTFTYDSDRFYLLKSVTTPSSRTDTYIYSPNYFSGTSGGQDGQNYVMKRADGTSDIPLPSDTAKLSKWKVESSCDERFCFSVVKDGDNESLSGESGITQKMYVEVKRNSGNYFDPRSTDNGDLVTMRLELGDATTTADEWKLYPAGNYFLAVGEHFGSVKLYEYDGIRWEDKTAILNGDPHWVDANANFNGKIKVFPSGQYFLVQTIGSTSRIVVAIRKATGWTTLNRTLTNCDLDNKGVYGDSIRVGSSGDCLEWTRNSLFVTTSPNFFTVADSATGAFTAYAIKQDGSGFGEISRKFGVNTVNTTIQKSGYPMKWEKQILSVSSGGDYILIQSRDAAGVNLSGFSFDGDTLKMAANYGQTVGGYMQVFPSENYFVVADPFNGKTIRFFQRGAYESGTGDSFSNSTVIRSDMDTAWKVLVRTHPSAFSIEYYLDSASYGLRPRHESATNYDSRIYQVNRLLPNGYKDRTGNLMKDGVSLFNISFSPSDNMLVATYGWNNNGPCNENVNVGSCAINYYTVRFHPLDTAAFIYTYGTPDRNLISNNIDWKPLKQSHAVMTTAARMGMQMTLDTTGSSKRIRYRQFQFDGKGFATPDSQFVVTGLVSHSSLADENRNRVTYYFFYAPYGSGIAPVGQAEFNSHTLTPQFEFADVKQVNSVFGSNLGTNRTFFNLDHASNTLMGRGMSLIGSEKYFQSMSGSYDTTLSMTTLSEPYHNPVWPKALYVTHPKASYFQNAARNLSHMSDTTSYFNFCDTNGMPRFILRNNRPDKIVLSQSIFDSLGFSKQSLVYKLSTQPDTGSLKTWNPTTVYSTSNVIAASKSEFKGYYFQQDSLWREYDQSLGDSDLRNGTAPAFSLNEGWLPASTITRRDTNNFFQTLETKVAKNKLYSAFSESYSSVFYEGLRSDPVGAVQNAKLENCAILLGENGNAVLPDNNFLDYQKRWEKQGGIFQSSLSHTGRYSIQVTDGYGPAINLSLKDVRDLGYGFRVSAWAYSDTGTPNLIVERRRSNNTLIETIQGNPVSGDPSAKRVWQRWEVNLTCAQVTSNDLFNGSSDFLRIRIGTGNSIGSSSRIVYVDDIVCLPSNASFNLTTYDKLGPPSSITNGSHITTYYDIGFKGNVSAVRDDQFRIFTQAGMHKMGEN